MIQSIFINENKTSINYYVLLLLKTLYMNEFSKNYPYIHLYIFEHN